MAKEIIFDELEKAIEIDKNGISSLYGNELRLLARYYRFLGNGDKLVEKKLIEICKRFDPQYNEIINGDYLRRVVRGSKRFPLRFGAESIWITKEEIDTIRGVKDFKKQKVLFVMLVLGKIGSKDSESEKIWIDDKYMNQVKTLAGIKINKTDFRIIYLFSLQSEGLLYTVSTNSNLRKYSTSATAISFGEKKAMQGEIEIKNITDDMVDLYVNYCGGELNWCAECGKEYIKENKSPYCKECSLEKKREKRRKWKNSKKEKA